MKYKNNLDSIIVSVRCKKSARLATRLRESGMLVSGIGDKKTPNPFIVACDKFIYIEIIGSIEAKQIEQTTHRKTIVNSPIIPKVDTIDMDFINFLKISIDDLADDNGWAFLAEVGALIIKTKPDFDPRNYGFSKLPHL